MHCSGFKRADNVGTYFGRMYQPRYLSGNHRRQDDREPTPSATSRRTRSRGDPRHQRVRARGASRSTPRPRCTSSGPRPGTTRPRSARRPRACSTSAPTSSPSTRTRRRRSRRRRSAVTTASATTPTCPRFAPAAHLTAPIWNWEVVYERWSSEVHNGTWSSYQYWGGIGRRCRRIGSVQRSGAAGGA